MVAIPTAFLCFKNWDSAFNSYPKITAELLANSSRLKIQDYPRLGKIKSYFRIKVKNESSCRDVPLISKLH